MSQVGKKYEVRKGGGGINIVFGQLYTPLLLCLVQLQAAVLANVAMITWATGTIYVTEEWLLNI
jgi:hypothetical protein